MNELISGKLYELALMSIENEQQFHIYINFQKRI